MTSDEKIHEQTHTESGWVNADANQSDDRESGADQSTAPADAAGVPAPDSKNGGRTAGTSSVSAASERRFRDQALDAARMLAPDIIRSGPEAVEAWYRYKLDRDRGRIDAEDRQRDHAVRESELAARFAEADRRLEASTQKHRDGYRLVAVAQLIRSVALLIVLLVIVVSPLVVMFTRPDIRPSDFIQFIAPVTGIAGTIVGYWFARADGDTKGSDK